jgi:ABC-type bacteriocin/lantibiotic exporter with double-glycine peptidase domain
VASPQGKLQKKASSERLRELWPDIMAMVRPRRGILSIGLVLIIINRVAGFVLPGSTRYLIDDVINKHQSSLLLPLTLAVVGATAIQGVTSFSLTQLLSADYRSLTSIRTRPGSWCHASCPTSKACGTWWARV